MSAITSAHFAQQLFYDNDEVGPYSANFNGNINSSKFTYNFVHDRADDLLGSSYNSHQFYEYDDNNRLRNFRNIKGEAAWGRAQYDYNVAGNITSLDRYNIDKQGNQVVTNYNYNYSLINNQLETVRDNNQQLLREL